MTTAATMVGTHPAAAKAGASGVRSPAVVVRVAVALLALMASAQVRVPLPGTDVPATLQLLAVLLTGLLLPPGAALAAAGLYLLCGAAGLPVFAGSASSVLGPTGGYLVGFVVAAPLVSITRGEFAAGWWRCLAAASLGAAVIFACGVLWRAAGAALLPGGVAAAVYSGLFPFLPKAAVEVALAAAAARQWRRGREPRVLVRLLRKQQ
ncbi:MAG: biotin transporter BioY [Planctomycetes bacterium]|nr:biotin transporter BioY [Planctomycetota bacterium]